MSVLVIHVPMVAWVASTVHVTCKVSAIRQLPATSVTSFGHQLQKTLTLGVNGKVSNNFLASAQ